MRYPRVGGRRRRHFAGTNLQPRKLPENAATPTRQVHAVLGRFLEIELIYKIETDQDFPSVRSFMNRMKSKSPGD